LTARFGAVAQPVDDVGVIAGADLVVNATSVGLRDNAVPIDVGMLRPDSAVVDLVYRSGETQLVRDARARGLRAIDGTIMLWEQGALAFERWFGRAPDREVMWRALTDSPMPR
jgi:shikimate dehydrogenase